MVTRPLQRWASFAPSTGLMSFSSASSRSVDGCECYVSSSQGLEREDEPVE